MDREDFTQLVLEAESTLFHVSFSLLHNEQDCADVVQEAVLKAWTGRSRLKEKKYFRTWLVRILINECYTFLRRQKRCCPLSEDIQKCASEFIKEEYLDLYRAMERLPEKDRLCVQLYYMEEFSIKQIAQTLKIPEGTVKSRLHTARTKLKKLLV